jgi:predicted PurR-regulated permease PerM
MSNPRPSVTSPPWDVTTKRLVALVALVLFLLLIRQVSTTAWSSVIVATVLAYLLSPVVTFFEHRLKWLPGYETRRTLAVFLTWFGVLGVLGLLLGLVIPATVRQLREFGDNLPGLIESTQDDLKDLLDDEITIGDFTFVPWDELQQSVSSEGEAETDSGIANTLQNAVLSLANPALDALGGVLSFLFTIFFVLAMLFYLMRDGPKFVDYLTEAAPESYRGDVRRLFYELGLVWNAYLRGQVMLGLAVGTATYIDALILGLPQPLVLALVAAFLEFIPNLGPALAQVPALLFALTTPSSTIPGLDAGIVYAIVVSLTYILIQNLEAIFLVPRILGHSLDLHPFVVLVAVLLGASISGVLGVILAAPSVATLRLVGRYLRGKLLDEEVFPSSPAYTTAPSGFLYRLMRYFLRKRFPVEPPEGTPSTEQAVSSGERSERSEWVL